MSKYVKKEKYVYDRPYKYTQEEIIEQFKAVHGDKYDYSLVVFKTVSDKVDIICPKHGVFQMTPTAHRLGQNCPKCTGRYRTTESLISEFREVHGDKYDYSKVEFTKMNEKVCIICSEHGEFWQTPSKHLISGHGCPKCGKRSMANKQKLTLEEWIERAKKVHKDKYDYSKVKFDTLHDKVTIICPKHGEFEQFAYDHLNGHGCNKCGSLRTGILSKGESEVASVAEKTVGADNVIRNDRSLLGGKELDVYIPSLKIGIEYNGLMFHSEKYGKDRWYHLNKTEGCNRKNVKLLQIFEDEYYCHRELVLAKVKHLLGGDKDLPTIYGRKCAVRDIEYKEGKEFLDKFHIQGNVNSTVYLGCFYEGSLIAVMSFNREKKGSDKWELARFATDINYKCPGVGGKLFKAFVDEYKPTNVKSFADRRWTLDKDNNLYISLGFKLTETLKPDYKYVFSRGTEPLRLHKFNFRKQILVKKYPDEVNMNMTETEMTEKLGYIKIWDCGLWRYEWNNEEKIRK